MYTDFIGPIVNIGMIRQINPDTVPMTQNAMCSNVPDGSIVF